MQMHREFDILLGQH